MTLVAIKVKFEEKIPHPWSSPSPPIWIWPPLSLERRLNLRQDCPIIEPALPCLYSLSYLKLLWITTDTSRLVTKFSTYCVLSVMSVMLSSWVAVEC